MKNMPKEIIENNNRKIKENRDKKEIEKSKMIKKIQTEYKDMLLPTLKSKTEEITQKIVEKLEERGENVNSIEILSTIAKRSLVDVATGNANSYTPQEIMIAFNLYIEMIDKIQKYKNPHGGMTSAPWGFFVNSMKADYNREV